MSTDLIPYRYLFADGTEVMLPLSGPWYACLCALDREEENNDRRETRRHCSLEDCRLPPAKGVWTDLEGREIWAMLLHGLTGREQQVGTLYFRLGYSQREIAGQLGLSRSRVAQLIGKLKSKWKLGQNANTLTSPVAT